MISFADIEAKLNLTLPSPVDQIQLPLLKERGISLYTKRDDLIHPLISGNKWRKLKYNISTFFDRSYEQIISFGGTYSNHLYALSEACHTLDIPFVALVRGDGYDEENTTLSTLKNHGTKMHFVSRSAYRLKEKSEEVKSILNAYNHYFLIPEGGSNAHALLGLNDLSLEIDWDQYDDIFVSAGTGATAASLLKYIIQENLPTKLHVVSALKGSFMKSLINEQVGCNDDQRLIVYNDFHFGGYAKMPPALLNFAEKFTKETAIPLDLVYNAKTMYGLLDLIDKKEIEKGSRILFINTGGRRP